jgi:hypothetical protein
VNQLENFQKKATNFFKPGLNAWSEFWKNQLKTEKYISGRFCNLAEGIMLEKRFRVQLEVEIWGFHQVCKPLLNFTSFLGRDRRLARLGRILGVKQNQKISPKSVWFFFFRFSAGIFCFFKRKSPGAAGWRCSAYPQGQQGGAVRPSPGAAGVALFGVWPSPDPRGSRVALLVHWILGNRHWLVQRKHYALLNE